MQKISRIMLAALFSNFAMNALAEQDAEIPKIEIPKITSVKYNKARALLIEKGWKPVITVNPNELLSADSTDIQAKAFWKAGYEEINACSGAGPSPCVLYFDSAIGPMLQVNTIGESSVTGDDFPIVSNYEIITEIPISREESDSTTTDKVANNTSIQTLPHAQSNNATYPPNTKYLAEITCEFNSIKTNVIACFTETNLKVQTTQSTELYNAYNLPNAGIFNRTTLTVPLPEHFEFTAQNSHKTMALGTTIRDLDGEVVFTDKVGQYETIWIQN